MSQVEDYDCQLKGRHSYRKFLGKLTLLNTVLFCLAVLFMLLRDPFSAFIVVVLERRTLLRPFAICSPLAVVNPISDV